MVPTAPQVLDPSAANRCNLFEFSQIQSTAATREPVPTAFFGSAAPPIARDSASARRRFNQLFGET
jgi:hypothetical protein